MSDCLYIEGFCNCPMPIVHAFYSAVIIVVLPGLIACGKEQHSSKDLICILGVDGIPAYVRTCIT